MSQAGSACLPLQTHPKQAPGGGHLCPPWCAVFVGRRVNVSAMRRQASAVLVGTTLAFFKGTNSLTLGLFSCYSKTDLKRWFLRGRCLEESCPTSQEGENTPQPFFTRWSPRPPSPSFHTDSMIVPLSPVAPHQSSQDRDLLVIM